MSPSSLYVGHNEFIYILHTNFAAITTTIKGKVDAQIYSCLGGNKYARIRMSKSLHWIVRDPDQT